MWCSTLVTQTPALWVASCMDGCEVSRWSSEMARTRKWSTWSVPSSGAAAAVQCVASAASARGRGWMWNLPQGTSLEQWERSKQCIWLVFSVQCICEERVLCVCVCVRVCVCTQRMQQYYYMLAGRHGLCATTWSCQISRTDLFWGLWALVEDLSTLAAPTIQWASLATQSLHSWFSFLVCTGTCRHTQYIRVCVCVCAHTTVRRWLCWSSPQPCAMFVLRSTVWSGRTKRLAASFVEQQALHQKTASITASNVTCHCLFLPCMWHGVLMFPNEQLGWMYQWAYTGSLPPICQHCHL